jgi:excinuclease ABC subunit C
MIEETYDLEFITVDTEAEALILEINLIKKYKPKFNVLMRDDKTYSWILVEKYEKGINDFPKIRIIRDKDKDKYTGYFFGPYINTVVLKDILKNLRRIFPFASCNRKMIQISNNPIVVKTSDNKPCLYYHIGLCQAPCASKISSENYLKSIKNIKTFLEGKKQKIIQKLEMKMKNLAKQQRYEEAALVRDKINNIKYVLKFLKIDNEVDEIIIQEIKNRERNNALKNLILQLNFPSEYLKVQKNFKIECYDISNIQGAYAVGSMVVSIDGATRKDLFRKFRIKSTKGPNDYAMLQEVLRRRLLKSIIENQKIDNMENDNVDESFAILPNLIIIDGGKGQLTAAYKILLEYNLQQTIPIIALAKREEEIFKFKHQFSEHPIDLNQEDIFERILLPKNSEELFLIQRIRDETHRFGVSYYRKLSRLKNIEKT